MGIYDRDYYRESTRFHADGRVQAYVVLIVLYIAIYILQIATREDAIPRQLKGPVTEAIELNADKVINGEVWRVITYALGHDPLRPLPIICNILFLIYVGRVIEDLYGWKEFLSLYFVVSLMAAGGFLLVAVVTQERGAFIGPQAAITGILLVVAMHNPKRTVMLFGLVACPIWFIIVLNVLLDVVGYFGDAQPKVLAAHAFAAGFGYLYHHFHLHITNWLPSWPAGGRKTKGRPKLQIYRDETERQTAPSPATPTAMPAATNGTSPAVAPAPAATAVLDEQLEAKVDEVLEKVKRHGQESLTDEERAVLFRASEIYRKRRKTGE